MKKLIILALLSCASLANTPAQPIQGIVKPVKVAKRAFSAAKQELKEIAQDVGGQFKEAGQDMYNAIIAPVINAVKNVATSVADTSKTAYRQAASSHIAQEAKEIAQEVGEQMAEIGHELYENGVKTPAIIVGDKAAVVTAAIKNKGSQAWGVTLATVEAVKEELAN